MNQQHTAVTLYAEACDCGDRVMHDNGGNYHQSVVLHTYDLGDNNVVVVLEDTTTREVFPRDNFDFLVRVAGEYQLVTELEFDGDENEIAARYLRGEAKIMFAK